jgi:small subunit ribosomal protein S17
MADEDEIVNGEQPVDGATQEQAPVDETPQEAGDQAPSQDAPPPPGEQAPADEAPSKAGEQAPVESAPQAADAGEPGEDEGGGAAPVPAPAAPVLAPKERRRLARAAKAPATRPARSAQERQDERDGERAKKAHARRHGRARARAEKPASTAAAAEAVERAAGRPMVRQGVVTSDKADKTITVRVDTARRHRRYKKIVRRHTTFHAHDERNEAHEGDLVRIVESRPLSATKRWRLVEILERAR